MSRQRPRTFAQVNAAMEPCPTPGCMQRRHYSEALCLDCKIAARKAQEATR